ncbi:adenine deaminase [Desulforhopalus singaporensis]|uniref:Adenine deaminase n=1 Tax=Desulforhopalus singaporensis TaxID=91360 RepID=A0A1H0U225_9BACT|nr:adenine deaminase [Desulforhopalus singaporensis]SDP60214.1 Adenine deaminase [Desulforhopalus singaporensis]
MLKERIFAATKQLESDLVFVGINVVDVFSQDIFTADVAVHDGLFVGIGDYQGLGRTEVDGGGKYIVPGFIDGHAHIESALVTPVEYGNTCLPHGVTAVIADPHEIANVSGVAGIEFIIENSRRVAMDFYIMLPSCVPATAFEHSGCVLNARDLHPLYGYKEVTGLAEVMNLPAVVQADPEMLEKIADALKAGRTIDGHMAGFTLDQLNAYATANIRTDHECDSGQGLIDRVRRGIYTLVREGTVCKDLVKMVPAINTGNAPMLCFATDDKHLDELVRDGGVDCNVRLAIANGIKPATAIQMASLNTARCYNLRNIGGIAPGYKADFSIVSDLEGLVIDQVYKNGSLVAEKGRVLKRVEPDVHQVPKELLTSVTLPEVGEDDLQIDMKGCSRANIIEIVPGTIVSNHLVEEVEQQDGRFRISTDRDQLKVCVIERHNNLGHMATGIVKGLRLKKGAIATTIAHDSHNLIVVGARETDMVTAVSALAEMAGGIVVVDDGEVLASLKLEISGLITSRKGEEVVNDLKRVHEALEKLAPECRFNPVLALSFLSLVVIPQIKISDSGLFDFATFSFIEVPVGA